MAKGRNKKRSTHQRHTTAPHVPPANSQHHEQQSDHGAHDPWLSRLRTRIAAANKAMLAAIGVGLAGAVTAAVISVPHLVATKLFGPPSPLTVAGTSSGNYPGAPISNLINPKICSLDYLGGTYLIPGTLHLPRTMSTEQLVALKNKAIRADADSTIGTYTLQANPGQTDVVTAVHVVVIRRVPAPLETTVEITPPCNYATSGIPPLSYDLSVNLDAKRLSPVLTEEDFNPNDPNQVIKVSRLQVVVTNEAQLLSTSKVTPAKMM
jgi:hypothetical protein